MQKNNESDASKNMLVERKIQKKRRTILKVKSDFRFIRKNVSHLFS